MNNFVKKLKVLRKISKQESTKELEKFLVENSGKPFSRSALTRLHDFKSDREMRRAIQSLRIIKGLPIVSTSDRRGYFHITRKEISQASDKRKEVEHMVKEIYSRIRSLRKMIEPIERLLHPEGSGVQGELDFDKETDKIMEKIGRLLTF